MSGERGGGAFLEYIVKREVIVQEYNLLLGYQEYPVK